MTGLELMMAFAMGAMIGWGQGASTSSEICRIRVDVEKQLPEQEAGDE